MAQSRLDLISPDLDRSLGPQQARTAASVAVRAALAAHPSDAPAVREVLQALQLDDWKKALTRRPDIEGVVERLDQEYLDLYAMAGEENTPLVIEAFARARAVAALAMALGSDETMAAKEAVYEAYASLGESAGEEMLASIRSVLTAP
jgi:hypothetical protein